MELPVVLEHGDGFRAWRSFCANRAPQSPQTRIAPGHVSELGRDCGAGAFRPFALTLRRPCGVCETLLLLLQELRDLARLVYRELLYLTVLRAGKGI